MGGEYISIADSLNITVICMVIVFSVLVFIAFILDLFKVILSKTTIKENKQYIEENNNLNKIPKQSQDLTLNKLEENDMVAIMASAIMLSGEKSSSNVYIKSIKKLK